MGSAAGGNVIQSIHREPDLHGAYCCRGYGCALDPHRHQLQRCFGLDVIHHDNHQRTRSSHSQRREPGHGGLGDRRQLPGSGSDPNVPALTPLTFNVVQTSGPALIGITVSPASPTSATVSFTAPAVGVVSQATLSLTATNTAPLTSAAVTIVVTINPPAVGDTVLITSAEYRTGKQRLIINATSNAAGPVTLKLQPYLTTTGAIYNPAPSAGGLGDTFTFAAGVYILDITGAPAPACGNAAGYPDSLPDEAYGCPIQRRRR